MKKLLFAVLLVGGLCTAFVGKNEAEKLEVSSAKVQGSGIEFQSVSFKEALALAQESGKMVFVDAYTDWCGPCKVMARTSFMDARVGKLFNDKFINVKIEMEKSADGPNIAKSYRVNAYPTLIFMDENGKLVKSVVGLQSADDLIAIANSL